MTKKINKENHQEILRNNSIPVSPEETEEILYGDKNNPHEKVNYGEKDLNFPVQNGEIESESP